jgi:predicted nucleic acid-binding Zn ribbon protein
MPIYVYETIPRSEEEQPERFEVYQSIKADALQAHPETGKPIRRIVVGGMYIPMKSVARQGPPGGDCCGTC